MEALAAVAELSMAPVAAVVTPEAAVAAMGTHTELVVAEALMAEATKAINPVQEPVMAV